MTPLPRLEVVRASGAAREHGVQTRRIEGVDVPVTTPAKTVADCFRFRRHVGLEVARAALQDYLRKRKGSIDALVEAARADASIRSCARIWRRCLDQGASQRRRGLGASSPPEAARRTIGGEAT